MASVLTIEEYKALFISFISKYFDYGGIVLKDGNVREVANVYSYEHYVFVYLPSKIKELKKSDVAFLDALEYAHRIGELDDMRVYIEAFKKGIVASNERYMLAKDGLNYLKELGNNIGSDGNVIVIEYKKN